MMHPIRLRNFATGFIALIATMAITACAGPTNYKPAPDEGAFGYSQQKLQTNRYRVKFSGNDRTERETVENYLLYRAAELTLEQGGDYFVVERGDTERDVERTTAVTGVGFGFSPFFFGGGFGGSGATSSREDYTAYGTISIHKGAPASELTNAYDARELQANLESKIKREES